ncbi:MAG: hypothetical protein HYX67_02820 [Candidatus Melainabacteria bacterium]|nr:hypothetical protein [Candidatus Melainabacteria bacterium]
MNTILLIIVLAAAIASGLQMFPLAEKYNLPRLLSALLWGSFIIFLGSLIPGALGCYAPLPVSSAIVSISLVSIFTLWKTAKVLPQFPRLLIDLAALKAGPWNLSTKIISVVSLLLLYPYAVCFANLTLLLFSPSAELGWDAVSYHLPALIEFIQAHSFWTFEGPYQSYSYGFELIYGLSILFCHSHWSVVIGHALSVVLMLLSTAYVTRQLLDTLRECGIEKINRLMVHLLVQAIWAGMIFRTSLGGVGNNDVFEAAMLVASFGYFLDLAKRNREDAVARNFLLCLSGMSYVLALATKSPALAFAPLFVLMASTEKPEGRLGLKLTIAGTLRAAPWFAIMLGVGTFFLWHNISKFGGMCDPDLAIGFRDTLLHHLRDPRLLKPTLGSVMFFSSGLSLVFFWTLWRRCGKGTDHSAAASFLWLAALYLIGAAAFSYTPFGVTPDYDVNNLTRLFFQDRKAMVMYMATALSLSLSIGVWCADFTKTPAAADADIAKTGVPLAISAQFVAILLGCFCAFVPAINWWWHRDWPMGLTGYETVKGLPRTNIYRWVQNLDTAKRIYSSGLRPYGLFGRDYENRLFYDLHSHILNVERQGRLLAVLDQFHPDLVLISVDPHAYTGGPQKPDLVEWMKQQPCFTQVYEDETVTGFRVSDGWREALQKYKLPSIPVRMHS